MNKKDTFESKFYSGSGETKEVMMMERNNEILLKVYIFKQKFFESISK